MADRHGEFFPRLSSGSTMVECLRYRALHQPQQLAFMFLQDGETESDALTYEELDCRSRAIATHLQSRHLQGERALLLYPAGLDYLTAFLGCLYAGVIAVPAYPPRNVRNTPRIEAIAADAEVAIALTDEATLKQIKPLFETTGHHFAQWLTTDQLADEDASGWQDPLLPGDTLAFLQYTSGSTETPKGVMLCHRNLLANLSRMFEYLETSPVSKIVSWLPLFHDMGLIYGGLQPIYGGIPCVMMPPASFTHRPYRWLRAISHYRATISGGPNFAYELCLRKITPEQRDTLDLSSWDLAPNGAEPIRQDTLERFAAMFATCGFRPETFYPTYGLAEATLMVSGGRKQALPVTKTIQAAALEQNQVFDASSADSDTRTLIGCGSTLQQQRLTIVNPATHASSPEGEIGEIWVAGPSIGQGYWNRPDATAETFAAHLANSGDGPFLRTGDLGFLAGGELFITGRVKDLIIMRGRNLYPQDIELTSEQSHPALRSGGVAAFSIEVNREEQLVVVQELEFRQKPNLDDVASAIREAVVADHEVQVYAVVLIKPGTIAKTTSGKIQRRACRAAYLADELKVLHRSVLRADAVDQVADSQSDLARFPEITRATLLNASAPERLTLLTQYLQQAAGRLLQISPHDIKPNQPLSRFGLDSLTGFDLKNQLERCLEVHVSIADLLAGATVSQIAIQIAPQLTSAPAVVPIQRAEPRERYPLASAQQRLWFMQQLNPETPAYHIPVAIDLTGDLNVAALGQSLNAVIRRQAVLRTQFEVVQGQPFQTIAPQLVLKLSTVDLRSLPPECQSTARSQISQQFAQTPFNWPQGPFIRVLLLQMAPRHAVLLLVLHHIVTDGWSMGVLLRELAAQYESLIEGTLPPSAELPIQYVDYAVWQQSLLRHSLDASDNPLQKPLAYWQQKLSSSLQVLNLPTDYPRPAVQRLCGARQTIVLSADLTAAIKTLCQQAGVTLFMTLLAAWQTLLLRYTHQTDIVIGSPVANRQRAEVEGLIGFFINTIVLRTDLAGDPSFQQLLQRVRSVALEAYEHQDLPFEKLVESLPLTRHLTHQPLFQVMFALQNFPLPALTLGSVQMQPQELGTHTARFDLALWAEETEKALSLTLEYSTDLFRDSTITRMLQHFQRLLEGIVSCPEQRLSELPLLTTGAQQQLQQWHQTQVPDAQNRCIHHWFEAQAAKTPDAIVVVYQDQTLTYRQLNQQANQLAHFLQGLGVRPEVLVGLCVERSPLLLIGLLGILKAGGAYLPLDPAYPAERLTFMLTNAQAPVLLTQQPLLTCLPNVETQVVCLDQDWANIATYPPENPCSQVTATNLAYVIYTSGSTGIPKGVLLSHQGLGNLATAQQQWFDVQPQSRVLQFASLSFDASIWEIVMALCAGASLHLGVPEQLLPGMPLLHLLRDQAITHATLPPTALAVLPTHEPLPALQTLIVAGEACDPELARQWGTGRRFFNAYGPTEATVCATISECGPAPEKLPIGSAIANTQVHVLDARLQPVPIGVPGELHIGGASLARGYRHQPDLTAAKFIPDPFSSVPGARLYKSGDWVRYREDGQLEYLGRMDHQVKVRGHRIELGEVEAALRQQAAVRQGIVIAQAHQDSQRLVAYVVPHPGQTPTTSDLQYYLKQTLPDYMVPSAFVVLDKIPLLPNGKVDRKALPLPADDVRPALASAYVQPHTPLERTIATIWQQALGLGQVGIHDNFFELGGHSLLLSQVHSQIQTQLQRDMPWVDKPRSVGVRDRVQRQKAALHRHQQLIEAGRQKHG